MPQYPKRLDEIEEDILTYCPECGYGTPHRLTYGFYGNPDGFYRLRCPTPAPAFYIYCERCGRISTTMSLSIRHAENHDNRPLKFSWDDIDTE